MILNGFTLQFPFLILQEILPVIYTTHGVFWRSWAFIILVVNMQLLFKCWSICEASFQNCLPDLLPLSDQTFWPPPHWHSQISSLAGTHHPAYQCDPVMSVAHWWDRVRLCICGCVRETDRLEVCARYFCPESLAVILHHCSLPSNSSVRKGSKLSLNQWAGPCCNWSRLAAELSQVKLQIQPAAASTTSWNEKRSLSVLCGCDGMGIVFSCSV